MSVTQDSFTKALLDPQQTIPDGVIDPLGRPAGKRFNVYRNNVVVSLIDAMETAFPVIQKLVGPDSFRKLAGLYVRQHPPTSPMLMFYGESFPAFLEGFEPLAKLPYLPDVARLELARRETYHGADHQAIVPDALAQIPPDQLMETTFRLTPTLKIVQSPYPIVAIWDFNMTPNAAKPPAIAQTALITRPQLDLEMRSISTGQATFLQTLQSDASLATAFDNASTIEADFDLSAAIVLLLQTEIITEINIRSPKA